LHLQQLLVGIFEFLRHEVEIVPARVGEQSRINCQSDVTGLGISASHRILEILRVAHAEPPETGHHNDYQSEDLGAGEDVLHSGRPFDIVAINDGQQTCERDRTMKLPYAIVALAVFTCSNHVCENNLMIIFGCE